MGASIEEDYLFELLSWTPVWPHIHAHTLGTAIARYDAAEGSDRISSLRLRAMYLC